MATARAKTPSKASQPDEEAGGERIAAVHVSEAQPQLAATISYARMLLRYADKVDLVLITFGVAGSVLSGVLAPVFTVIFGDLLNAYFGGNVQEEIHRMVLYILYIAIGAFVGGLVGVGGLMWNGARQANRVRGLYLQSYLRQDIAFFDTESGAGRVLQGLTEDSAAFQNAMGDKLSNFIHSITMFAAGTAIAFWRGWALTLVFLSAVPALVILTAAVGVMQTRLQAKSNKAYASAASLSQQALSNIRTVASYTLEDPTVQSYQAALAQPLKVGIWQGLMSGLTLGATHFVFFGAYGLTLWYGSQQVADGHTTGGYVMNVLLAAVMAGFGLGQAMPHLHAFQRGCSAAANLFAIIARRPTINPDAPGQTLDDVRGDLELQDVTFSYPARPDRPVLQQFSLVIPAGRMVALVGESGSGKSSVVSLLQRFYDPQGGAVLLDGRDMRTLQLRWLRSQMGLVSQEPALFAANIRDNIAMGLPRATDEQIIQAATAANAYGFILKLPQGLHTMVGERGAALSGGQKQRIAIARALLRNPKILLLDEATSALDAQSEKAVQGALDALMTGSNRKTVVVVAHRLSTIISADTIAVVKNGGIVEMGNHSSLLKIENGAYRNLVARQQMVPLGGAEREPGQQATGSEDKPASKRPLRKLRDSVLRRGSVRLSIIPESVRNKLSGEKAAGEEATEEKVPFSRLAALQTKREWFLGSLGMVASAALGLQMPGFSLALAAVMASMFSVNPHDVRWGGSKWGLVFMGIGIGCLVLESFQGWSFAVLGQNLANRVRILVLRAVLKQDMAWFDKDDNNSGSVMTRLGDDASAVRGACADSLGLLIQNLACVVASYVIAFYSSWSVTLVVTALLPFMIAGQAVQAALTFGANKRNSSALAEANRLATEAVGSIRVVAAYGLQDKIASLYTASAHASGGRRASLAGGFSWGFSMFVLYVVFSLGFWFGGTQIREGRITFQEMLRAFLALFYCAFGLAQAQIAYPDVSKAGIAIQHVFGTIDSPSKIDPSSPGGASFEAVDGQVQLKDVTFAYPARPGRLVFKQFSLDVPAGSSCALVGESGHGKSTIFALLERFYDPLDGQVLLDGVDVRSLNVHWLRSQLALVSQEPVLFAGTIADNICMGSLGRTDPEALIAAARLANAFDFVSRLPEGFDTRVGGGGIQLSGGQKQRIAIARAVFRNPKVLLLDEATSALDAESEHLVQEALDRVAVGRTTITVAHRLSTVRHATKIAVVHRGRVLEEGTHDELVALHGYYSFLLEASQA